MHSWSAGELSYFMASTTAASLLTAFKAKSLLEQKEDAGRANNLGRDPSTLFFLESSGNVSPVSLL